MMSHKKNEVDFQFMSSWYFRVLPVRARLFFFSKLSTRYMAELHMSSQRVNDDMLVGYESSWPGGYTRLR